MRFSLISIHSAKLTLLMTGIHWRATNRRVSAPSATRWRPYRRPQLHLEHTAGGPDLARSRILTAEDSQSGLHRPSPHTETNRTP